MADTHVPPAEDGFDRPVEHASFEVAETAIPVGVQCRECGRLHLPERLSPRIIRIRGGRLTEVELRCDRCRQVGLLVLHGDNLDHHAILSEWRHGQAGPGGSDQERAGT